MHEVMPVRLKAKAAPPISQSGGSITARQPGALTNVEVPIKARWSW